jgi:hypothetical protein
MLKQRLLTAGLEIPYGTIKCLFFMPRPKLGFY